MMTIPLDQFLALCELCGGAIDPPKALALVAIIRKYAGITADMAQIIHDGAVPAGAFSSLVDRMEEIRVVKLPTEDPK